MVDDTLEEAELKMEMAVEHTKDEFAKIRTGRANPQLIADLRVDYYGAPTPLQQLAGVSAPEARVLLVSPYDRGALKEIERAIIAANLGLNPNNDGNVIRCVFPELTEERRREYVKLARERAEEGRIAVRAVRRNAKSDIERMGRDGDITEDDVHRSEAELQKITDDATDKIDDLLKHKEAELLEV